MRLVRGYFNGIGADSSISNDDGSATQRSAAQSCCLWQTAARLPAELAAGYHWQHLRSLSYLSMSDYPQIPLEHESPTEQQLLDRSARFLALMSKRRTVRDFSHTAVPQVVIEQAISVAGSAPSGANRQPWHFVAIQDTETKRQIREAAEHEERELYAHRASDEWLSALEPLGTNADKPFLQIAPWLIAVFAKKFSVGPDGEKLKNYYTPESVGIATGMLVTALHHAGLATLTHTPSPMGFLRDILNRPSSEKPFLLLVTGYPAKTATVPDIKRLAPDDIMSII